MAIADIALGGAGLLTEFGKELGLFDRLREKLIQQPDKAARHLAIVLAEISKIYEAITRELTKFSALDFAPYDDDQRLDYEARQRRAYEVAALRDLEEEKVKGRINEARGHCAKIEFIHDRFLTGWFGNLTEAEKDQVKRVFELLSEADGKMLIAAEEEAKWLGSQASDVLRCADRKDWMGADAIVRDLGPYLASKRKAFNAIDAQLASLNAEFIRLSKAI